MPAVTDRALLASLLTTPWLSSFVGRAHDGPLTEWDPARRAAAWAHWAVQSLDEFSGNGQRTYIGITLSGDFSPQRGGPADTKPHLEVPARTLAAPDPLFPERISCAGNTLTYPWWVTSEVIAARRVIFTPAGGDITPLLSGLTEYREGLAGAVTTLTEEVNKHTRDDLILDPDIADDITVAETTSLIPLAASLNLHADFDPKMRESNGPFIGRRIGVWSLKGTSETSGEFSLGVITPRIGKTGPSTKGTLAPHSESVPALLLRAVILKRLLARLHAPCPVGQLPRDEGAGARPYLRAIVAKAGAKTPEASTEAAVHFLHTFPDVAEAWAALNAWAGEEYLLTVSKESFTAAHVNSLRYLRRGEEPAREDINVVLPLAWDSRSRVVRATFSRGTDTH